MFSSLVKKSLLCSMVFAVAACSSTSFRGIGSASNESEAAKEKLYQSTGNHKHLIRLYRDMLKKQDNPEIRYKLSESYYQVGDSKASLLYLQPLLDNHSYLKSEATLLETKNLIQLRRYNDAISAANRYLAKQPKSGEGYNLRAIAHAQNGQLQNAHDDLMKARQFFISDTIALNNLAMLEIINGSYANAVELLLPEYLNGVREPRMLHNLVFALVKKGDREYALDIIRREKMNTSPEDLVNALSKTERIPTTVRK